MTPEELTREIRAAFSTGRRLKPDEVISHICEECLDVAAAFSDRTWQEVAPEVVDQHYQSLPLLAPEAFRQFLPAFLLRGLQQSARLCGASDVAEFAMYSLSPEPVTPWWQARVNLLSDSEVRAVRQWMGR